MPAVRLKLFNDITNRKFVVRPNDTGEFPFPKVFQEDRVNIEYQPLEINSSGSRITPYSVVSVVGLSLTIKIAKASDGTILASQTSFSLDTAANVITGVLDCNTAAMVTAMTGVASVDVYFEVELADATGSMTVAQVACKIYKEYITAGSPSALPLSSYLTRAECLALFVKFVGNTAGQTIELVSPDGTRFRIVGMNNDGSAQDDLI